MRGRKVQSGRRRGRTHGTARPRHPHERTHPPDVQAVFNVGEYRRQQMEGNQDASFFAAGNKDAGALREQLAMSVLAHALDFLAAGAEAGKTSVAVLDATNTTKERRANVMRLVRARAMPRGRIVTLCNGSPWGSTVARRA